MSIFTSAYLIYGVQIANTHSEDLEAALHGNTVGVGYLHAGPYDSEKTYLTVAFYEAELGKPELIDMGSLFAEDDPEGRWDDMLAHAVEKVGAAQMTQPGGVLFVVLNWRLRYETCSECMAEAEAGW